uniref:protein disulfide-isomerase n=1 Tax=Petromyzon marinus TaxID=7757 RepID=A0AAJ7X076_PETMA|nr:protein disulfide-isomerase TMX3-like isoform X1 [Petromyzon marinus]
MSAAAAAVAIAAAGACLLVLANAGGEIVELTSTLHDLRQQEPWLVNFYAPWCSHCKKLDPVWRDVALGLHEAGSPVRVGKMDAIKHSSLASEFGARGFPSIKLIKGDLAYNYRGPHSKEKIIEFANRVSGPTVLSLSSPEAFEKAQKAHDTCFVYVGGESPLKEKYLEVATELIVYTYFYSATKEALPEDVVLYELPAVLAFKDETFYVFDEFEDGSLEEWVNRERFPEFLFIDSITLHDLADTGKSLVLAVLSGTNIKHDNRLKYMVEEVSKNYRRNFHKQFQFGYTDGNIHINDLIMSVVDVPSVILVNTSSQQFFLPEGDLRSAKDLFTFITSNLAGKLEVRPLVEASLLALNQDKAHGGNSPYFRMKRLLYDASTVISAVFQQSVLLGLFLYGTPVVVFTLICYSRLWVRGHPLPRPASSRDRQVAGDGDGDDGDGTVVMAGNAWKSARGGGDGLRLRKTGGVDGDGDEVAALKQHLACEPSGTGEQDATFTDEEEVDEDMDDDDDDDDDESYTGSDDDDDEDEDDGYDDGGNVGCEEDKDRNVHRLVLQGPPRPLVETAVIMHENESNVD